ncbi:adenylate kinase [Candidatus Woesearchaeota archaeon]|jgi:adenylate kinase|nr:adenylate kinase [Candidatus Woesearchaeota archaeon]MBT6518741.1 adenylate kinase [Candidatus Woesearchaeota archaeon]MBT7366941.1 adenylate kinase [Candidatus Woesearchaeota archaeon]
MKLIFFGPPGAGKGTIAQQILNKYKIIQISTGDMFRENIKNQTEIGVTAKEYIDKGELVPDEVTITMLKNRIENDDCKNGFILDGFPRNIPQAQALDNSDVEIDRVIYFTVPADLIIHRLSGRRSCKQCNKVYNINPDGFPNPKVENKCDVCNIDLFQRADDIPATIKDRLDIYREQTEPLAEYYEKQGKLKKVNADGEIQRIIDDTINAIEN